MFVCHQISFTQTLLLPTYMQHLHVGSKIRGGMVRKRERGEGRGWSRIMGPSPSNVLTVLKHPSSNSSPSYPPSNAQVCKADEEFVTSQGHPET
ncbi:hypothetical protein CEXT_753521 [Caerostris extrusa]|uniref:Uncharacterized protein n=1 Tax=Caerostris extrusa TaxID=172846 RepID=A0AAV4RNN3_CAEEX|nr:hypothetical protein CEXT_753521 [Caerostris extrusa]